MVVLLIFVKLLAEADEVYDLDVDRFWLLIEIEVSSDRRMAKFVDLVKNEAKHFEFWLWLSA